MVDILFKSFNSKKQVILFVACFFFKMFYCAQPPKVYAQHLLTSFDPENNETWIRIVKNGPEWVGYHITLDNDMPVPLVASIELGTQRVYKGVLKIRQTYPKMIDKQPSMSSKGKR